MKSIMEQASSIMKAIEKAWDRAEKPKDFSIKIFEKEEKNFFGMTTKPAKIGIFFEDKNSVSSDKPAANPRTQAKEARPEVKIPSAKPQQQASPQKPAAQNKPQSIRTEQPKADSPKNNTLATELHKTEQQQKTDVPRRAPAAWNDEMMHTTQSWIKKTLSLMEMPSIEFTTQVTGKILKINFNVPLIEEPLHEKMLFRSFAHLIMASLRNQYKQEIKDLKILLIRPQ